MTAHPRASVTFSHWREVSARSLNPIERTPNCANPGLQMLMDRKPSSHSRS